MNFSRIHLILAAFFLACCSGGAPRIQLEYIGNLGDWTGAASPSSRPDSLFPTWPQSIASHDSLLFSFHTEGYVYVFDLRSESLLSHFKIETHNHCNNACFCGERASADSAFPLLYLTESVTDCDCEVFDITTDSARKVRHIRLSDHPEGTHGAGWSVDRSDSSLVLIYNHSAYRYRGLTVQEGECVCCSVDDRSPFCSLFDGESQSSAVSRAYLIELTGLGEGHDGLSLWDAKRNKSYRYVFTHKDMPREVPSWAQELFLPLGNEPEGICLAGQQEGEFYIAFAGEAYSDHHLYKLSISR